VCERERSQLPLSIEQVQIMEIAMFNLHLSVEQSLREQQGKRAREVETSLNTDLYSVGYFDGLIGLEPSHPEKHSYWEGYQIGSREFWAKKLGVEIPTEF
jgi:hypothetical protein